MAQSQHQSADGPRPMIRSGSSETVAYQRQVLSGMLTALLTSRAATALKGRLRRLRWTLAGRAVKNPPLPVLLDSVLFVCLGNICRSPFAAAIAGRRLQERGADVRCGSAGIRTTQGARPPGFACEAAAAYGLSLLDHQATTLNSALVAAHDLIVVMEVRHLRALRTTYPNASDRLVLLPLFDVEASSAEERYNIADPFGQPQDSFDACYRRIDRAVERLLEAVESARAPREETLTAGLQGRLP
jgi:protein-tyrosine phosphatase